MNSVCSIISNPEQYLSKSYLTYVKNSLETLMAYVAANGGNDYVFTPDGKNDYLFLSDLEEANGDYVEAIERKFARLKGEPKKQIKRKYSLPILSEDYTMNIEINGEYFSEINSETIHYLFTGEGSQTQNFTIFNKVGEILSNQGYTEAFIQNFLTNNNGYQKFQNYFTYNYQKLNPSQNLDVFAERLANVIKTSFLQFEQYTFQKSQNFNPIKVSIKNQIEASESVIRNEINSFYATLSKKNLIHSWKADDGKVLYFLSLHTGYKYGVSDITSQERERLIKVATEKLEAEIKRLGLPKNIIKIKKTKSEKTALVTIDPEVFASLQDDIANGNAIADLQITDNIRNFLEKKFNIKSQEIRVKDLPELLPNRKDLKNVNAFIQNNTVYLVRGRYNSDTVIEEFLHPFVNTLYNQNQTQFEELYQEAAQLFPKLHLQIEHDYRNLKEYNKEDLKQELVAQALSRNFREEWENLHTTGTILTTESVLKDLGKAESFWKKAWNFIKGLFKFNTAEFENLTLRDFARLLNATDSEFSLAFSDKRWYNLINTHSFEFKDGTVIRTPFALNEEQKNALQSISDFLNSGESVMTLSGYAGTGKTSLMEIIAQKCSKDRRSIIFTASTNKAAAVLKEKVKNIGFDAFTLNKIFGIGVQLDSKSSELNRKNLQKVFNPEQSHVFPKDIIVIDEASLIDDENYDFLNKIAQQHELKLIFLGDPAQLPPVQNNGLISKIFRDNNRIVTLTQVERTGDNAILREATNLRNGKPLSGETSLNDKQEGVIYIQNGNQNEINQVIQKLTPGLKNNPNYFRILTGTNDSVESYNTKVRSALGFSTPMPQVGEPMMSYLNWGYKNIDGRKTYKCVNSESYIVIRCDPPKPQTIWINNDKIVLQTSQLTVRDSLGVDHVYPFTDVKNNEANRIAVTKIANRNKELWIQTRNADRVRKAQLLAEIEEGDNFLFINSDIKGSFGNTLQSKCIDFGYAMTVHKSQGSTFTHVLLDDANIESVWKTSNVSNDSNHVDEKQSLKYVGVSRATDTVTIVSNNVKKEGSSIHYEKGVKEDKIQSAFTPEHIIISQLIDHLKNMGIEVRGRKDMEEYLKRHNPKGLQMMQEQQEIEEIKQKAIADGHAGVIYNNSSDPLKSETDNTEEFSTTDDNIRKFTTPQGEVYGFVDKDGNIYLDETVITSEHPIHEYTHLWDRVIAKKNSELWKQGIVLMKHTNMWGKILNDSEYGKNWQKQGITGERLDNLIASEVHARFTGIEGEQVLNQIAKEQGQKNIIPKLKKWLLDFWKNLKTTFSNWSQNDLNKLTLSDFNRMTIRDFAEGVDLNAISEVRKIEFLNTSPINIYWSIDENAELNNFAIRPFTHIWKTGLHTEFKSVEQAFQYAKALMAKDQDAMYKILTESQGTKLRILGENVQGLDIAEWNRFKESFMKTFIKESFEQNPKALQKLLATGNAVLTHTQDHGEWGQLFPKILMEVRKELKNFKVSSLEKINNSEEHLNIVSTVNADHKASELVSIPKFKGEITFDYGNNKRTEVTATSTFEAIRRGERTATTKYVSDGNIDYWKQAKIGDVIEFSSENGETIQVKVTKPLTRLDKDTNAEEWSKKEGWSVEYFNKFVKPRLNEAYQFEYEYIGDAGNHNLELEFIKKEDATQELTETVKENTGYDTIDLSPEDLYVIDFLLYVGKHSEKEVNRLIEGYIQGNNQIISEIESLQKQWLQREQELLYLKRWNTSIQVKQLPDGHWDFENYFKGIDITKPINEQQIPIEYGQIQNFSVKPAEIIAPKKYREQFQMGKKTLLELDSPNAFIHNDQWYASPLEQDGIASDFLIRTHNNNVSVIITDSISDSDEKSSIYTPILQKITGKTDNTFVQVIDPNVEIKDTIKETKITRKISLVENKFGSFQLDQSLKTKEFTLRFISENGVKITDLSQNQLNSLAKVIIESLPINAQLSLMNQTTFEDLSFLKTYMSSDNFIQVDKKLSSLKNPENKNIIKQTDDVFITDLKGNKLCQKPTGKYEIRNYLGHSVIVLEASNMINQDLMNMISSMDGVVSVQPLLENYMQLNSKNAKELASKLLKFNRVTAHNNEIFHALNLSPNSAVRKLKSIYSEGAEQYQKEYANILYNSFKRTLKIIAARIPTQAFQSFMEMEIVGFYETERNDTFVSRWQLWLQGSDLDIDKVYMLLFGVDEKGFLESWSKIADYTTLETSEISNELPIPNQINLILENEPENIKFRNKVISISESPTKIGELVSDWLNTHDKNITQNYWTAKYKKSGLEAIRLEIVRQILEEFNKTRNFDITFEEFTNPKLKKLISIINRHNLTPLTEEASKNLVLKSIHKVITDPRNYISSYSPIDEAMDLFLDKIKHLDDKTITHSYDDGISIFEAQYDNSVGKDDVGIMANGLKAFFNLTQYFNHFYKYNKDQINANSHKYFLRGFELYEHGVGNNIPTYKSTISDTQLELNEIRILNETLMQLIPEAYQKGARIATSNNDASLLISALVSLATDNAKTLALSKLKAGLELASMHIYMVTMGFSPEQIINYIKTPVFSKLVELVQANIFEGESGRINSKVWEKLMGWADEDPNKKEDVIALQNLYYSAQELTQLARNLGINQGLKADDAEIANTAFKFKNMLKNVVRRYPIHKLNEDPSGHDIIAALIQNHGLPYSQELWNYYQNKFEKVKLLLAKNNIDFENLEVDMNKYFSDEEYRNDIVEIYDLFKETFNLYDVINNSPNYYQMFNALNTHLNVLASVSVKSRISLSEGFEYYDPELFKNRDIISPIYGEREIKAAKRFVDDYIISDFLRTNTKIPFKIKTSNWELNSSFQDVNAIVEFTNFVNSKLIPQLKQSYLDNNWLQHMQLNLKNVRDARKKDLGKASGEYILNFNIDKLNPKSQDALKAKQILDDFNKLADLHLSEIFVNSKISGHDLTVGDLLYLYNLIIKNNSFGQNSLTSLFEKYSQKENSLFNDWIQQVLDFDSDRKSINIDPVLFTAYLNKRAATLNSKTQGILDLNSESDGIQVDVKVPLINMSRNLSFKNSEYEYLELLRELVNKNIIIITKKC